MAEERKFRIDDLSERFSFLEKSDYEVINRRLFCFLGYVIKNSPDSDRDAVLQFVEENLGIVDTSKYTNLSDPKMSKNYSLFLDVNSNNFDTEAGTILKESPSANYSSLFAAAGYYTGVLVSNHDALAGIEVKENSSNVRALQGIFDFVAKVAIGGLVTLAVIGVTGGFGAAFIWSNALAISVVSGITLAALGNNMSIDDFTKQVIAAGVTVASFYFAYTNMGPLATYFGNKVMAAIVVAGATAAITNQITKDSSYEWFPGVGVAIDKGEEIINTTIDTIGESIKLVGTTTSLLNSLITNFPTIALAGVGFFLFLKVSEDEKHL
jgi:hypothetical protein